MMSSGLSVVIALSVFFRFAPRAARSSVRSPPPSADMNAPLPTRVGQVVAVLVVAAVAMAGGVVACVYALVVVVGARQVSRRVRSSRRDRRADASIGRCVDELARLLRGGIAVPAALATALSIGDVRGHPPPRGSADDSNVSIDRWVRLAPTPARRDVAALLGLGLQLEGLHPEFVGAVSSMHAARSQLDDEIAAQSSQAHASAVVMTVAPIVFLVALVLTDPEAGALMLHSPIGSVLLAVGLGLDTAAFFWMRRIARSVRTS